VITAAQAVSSFDVTDELTYAGDHQWFMASGCIRRDLDWILGNISLLKEWLGIRTGCPGKWWSHHPWRCSEKV